VNDDTDNINNGYIEQIKTTGSTKKVTDKVKNDGNKLIIHYAYEKRFRSFKRDMHKHHEDISQNTPAINIKLIVGNRNRRSATH
jgi:hypothetical protein